MKTLSFAISRSCSATAVVFLAAALLTACGGGSGGPSDMTAPTLATAPAISPANGATNTSYTGTVQFTASEALSAASIKLSCAGTEVPGTTTVSGAVATFTPAAPGLVANVQCVATVNAAATKDIAGNAFTGTSALTSFTVKPLACAVGTVPNAPPSFNGVPLAVACNNVYIDPAVVKNQWPVIVEGINAAAEMDKKVFGPLQAQQPDIIVCNTGACSDNFAGLRRRNVTLYPNTYVGQYVVPRMTVVLTSATWSQNPYVLAHEFSHVEVAVRLNGQHVPAWFDEGLATYVGGEPICTNVTGRGIADLRTLDFESDWVAYTGPEDVFFKTYCQARAEVGAWIGKRGTAGVVQLLDAVRQGQPFAVQYGAMQTQ